MRLKRRQVLRKRKVLRKLQLKQQLRRRTHQRWRSRRRLLQPNSFIISDIVAKGEDEHSHAQQCRALLF
jgi:hypothetical protein